MIFKYIYGNARKEIFQLDIILKREGNLMKKLIACLVSIALCLFKKQAENPHLNIEYRWGMNAVNASDREIWSKK